MTSVVVIMGASAGVGRATAWEFAQAGAAVGLIARDRARLETAQREVQERGGRAAIYVADVADAEQVEQAAAYFEQELGPIDIWVNNVMTTVFAPFDQIRPEEFRRATEVTYLGVVYGTMSALRRMRARGRGTIVQVGSALAYRAIPLQAPYCGAKHAIRGFTDSIRSELIHDGSSIHLTMVQLPAMNTPQFSWCLSRLPNHPQPVPPIYQPEVAARAIYWAAHHRRREVNVGWSALLAIWGNKIAPGFADWYLAKNGYDGQQTRDAIDPGRSANLFAPVAGDYSAHGIFGEQAASSTSQWWVTTHRGLVLGGLVILILALVVGGMSLWG
jgi:short-subunit dehydrogenase